MSLGHEKDLEILAARRWRVAGRAIPKCDQRQMILRNIKRVVQNPEIGALPYVVVLFGSKPARQLLRVRKYSRFKLVVEPIEAFHPTGTVVGYGSLDVFAPWRHQVHLAGNREFLTDFVK